MNRRLPMVDRPHLWAFIAGCVAVTIGVLLHLPMYWMGRHNGFRLAEMPIEADMLWGMVLIVGGLACAAFGLRPRPLADTHEAGHAVAISAPEDAPLGPAHRRLMAILSLALVIDVMKPASLGFVVPGMLDEYGVPARTVAWLPFAALCGTVLGSVVWGALADRYGRRASILLSAVMFVGTSICGSMPSLWWNVGMCFLMGAAAGGMLPVTYALLAETMPSRQRGWALVLVGGLGAVGGYLAASGLSAWLQPMFGWRAMWFLNLPTGLVLILLNIHIPESPKFLAAMGRIAEAQAVLKRFGCVVLDAGVAPPPAPPAHEPALPALRGYAGTTWALSVAATAWGLINFGLLLWLPAQLVERGIDVALGSRLLAASSLIALPTVAVAALLYGRLSSKGALLGTLALTAVGLVAVGLAVDDETTLVLAIAVLLVGVNGLIAMLLPYAAESYPVRVRGRATGWTAACTKGGGLAAQGLSLLGLVPTLVVGSLVMLVPVLAALVLVWRHGVETRGRDLRELESPVRARERAASNLS